MLNKFFIKINDEIETLGLVTFQIQKIGDELQRIGMLKTHLYIEEIHSIECDRFKIDGVEVYSEAFGSTDVFNLYQFTYENFLIKEEMSDLDEQELLELYEKEVID